MKTLVSKFLASQKGSLANDNKFTLNLSFGKNGLAFHKIYEQRYLLTTMKGSF